MRTHALTRRPVRRALLGLAALGLAFAGHLALTQPGDSAAKQTAAMFLSASDFLPEHSGVGYAATGLGSRICTSSPFGEGGASLGAELDLPDGARVTSLTVYYLDNHSSANLGFGIGGKFIADGTGGTTDGALHLNDEIASGGSSGASESFRSTELRPSPSYEVDNAREDLELGVGFDECDGGDDLRLEGARVEYQPK